MCHLDSHIGTKTLSRQDSSTQVDRSQLVPIPLHCSSILEDKWYTVKHQTNLNCLCMCQLDRGSCHVMESAADSSDLGHMVGVD